MDWGDLLIFGVPTLIVLWLIGETWKARQDSWGVKAFFVFVIVCVLVAGGYLILHKEQVKKGNIPLLEHPRIRAIKARLNG